MTKDRALTIFEPTSLMRGMFRDFDRLFGAYRWPFFGSAGREFREYDWSPQLEIAERDGHLALRLDLPGVKKEEISVEVDENGLTISGERRKESEEKGDDWFRSERTYGSFYRVIPLPEGAKSSDVKATFGNGVLEITLPIPAKTEATTRKVAIGEATPESKKVKAAA